MKRLAVSLFIAVVLLLQVAAVVLGREIAWPFVDYPMYSKAKPKVVSADFPVVRVVYADGEVADIDREMLGGSFFSFGNRFMGPLEMGDADAPTRLKAELERTTGRAIVEMRYYCLRKTWRGGELVDEEFEALIPLDGTPFDRAAVFERPATRPAEEPADG